eukprot:TRINITY_DN4606_c0_g1_i1.p1 TRINITY_DN4606_c0_g1~~TRINITY_DN4606_c0_g1_i1.p1  ORF type:complete len:282 (-),score=32.60 TRINITY_DN4606_c0_g1_i1:602-1351(-)
MKGEGNCCCGRGLLAVVFLVFGFLLQIVALALAVSAVVVPLWVDPSKDNVVVFQPSGDGTVEELKHSGLWQVCFDELFKDSNDTDVNERIGFDELKDARDFGESVQNAFTSLDDCTRDGVEEFYKEEIIWGDNQWNKIMAVRATSILFVLTAFVKFFTILAAKCAGKDGGWFAFYLSTGLAVFEFIWGAIVIAVFSVILDGAADEGKSGLRAFLNEEIFDDFRDYAGASYWLFMVSVLLALISNFILCV